MTDATPSKAPSIIDDFVDIWTSPSTVFARRTDGKWGAAMLVVIVLGAILFFGTRGATQPIMDAEMARGMAASSNQMTPEQTEAAQSFGGIMTAAFVVIGTPIILTLLGLLVLIATKIVGGTISFAQGLTIACFAAFPRLVEAITNAAQALMMDESALTGSSAVSLGVGRFFDPDATNAALMALLIRVDLYTLWITVMIAIGIKVMGKRSNEQAMMAGAIVWLLGAVPTLLPALLRG